MNQKLCKIFKFSKFEGLTSRLRKLIIRLNEIYLIVIKWNKTLIELDRKLIEWKSSHSF